MTGYPRAPAHVSPYVEVLGAAGAVEFLLAFGGAELYLAANPKTRSAMVETIGRDRAAALAAVLGAGGKVRVPTAKPWIAHCLKHEGLPTAEIARRLHAADTTVRGWLARGGAVPTSKTDPRQLKLL